ncbi:iron uptake transporter deferrochelatase/peroxidase subunit [Paenibacillus apiarius]|uniref:Deferrochelatase n=1 Tax=Paenibacillus apiarius TaxID=46240 RepID=A0ABT4DNT1_9BACL|nr:iron uptake transporter deferrochelatase/peroxidase subunit [Paenibacillus apiarius]MCY9512839.1 iron uptake transporter deferrochelatase/peroxidase subunit [Paenibacillus apiarius]MCY9519017.1 iron uptake transporter deferrochelatase/peroxidase subunit [Paenibacillus apiarius]MCY9550826.1 iron uptake transporter deferrochelatase/peroxidase subunit [Paenibacillus apiarius]MCY9559740.1 iron uptake transporter deferrochelatase/peroxidase subunit [Paenibacillus apiarius]MCY9681983.1 iron uptak
MKLENEKGSETQQERNESDQSKMSRRELLKLSAAAGTGMFVGMGGMGAFMSFSGILKGSGPSQEPGMATKEHQTGQTGAVGSIPFHGTKQAGIATPPQKYICFAAFDITQADRMKLEQLCKTWTDYSVHMTAGQPVGEAGQDGLAPPSDSGEAQELSPAKLTITFGFGPTLFRKDGVDRFGLAAKQPDELVDIPAMPGDALNGQQSGGDICIQACSDDPVVSFHAIRSLARIAQGTAKIRWVQEGYLSAPEGQTPRNLFGFKDGTANHELENDQAMDRYVWASPSNNPPWMAGGTYLAVRKIRMFIDAWDHTALQKQEATFGRLKESGAPFGKRNEADAVSMRHMPTDSHVWLARGTGTKMWRRSYSYSSGLDANTGELDAGLLFISFQQSIKNQFIPMLSILAQHDALNKYTSHLSSAVFACPPGAQAGSFIGEALFH